MAESLAILLSLTCVGLVAVVGWLYRRDGRRVITIPTDDLERATPDQRIQAIVEVAKLRQADIPWFQKGLSTTGVVAFFAMLITTGLQTTRVAIESEQKERLKSEMAGLEAQRKEWDDSVSRTSSIIITAHQRTGLINDANRELLRQRLKQLQGITNLNNVQARETFLIALILQEGAAVIQAVERHPWLLESSTVGDRVSAAEYYYALGDESRVSEVVDSLAPKLSVLSEEMQIRLIVLQALIRGDDEPRGRLAALLSISRDLAQERIELGKEQLQALASRARYTREVTRAEEALHSDESD